MRITLSAILSASCSNLSPGLFTANFICTAGAACVADAKKLPPPAFAKKGLFDACVTVVEVVVDDFSAVDFIIGISERQTASLSPLHP